MKVRGGGGLEGHNLPIHTSCPMHRIPATITNFYDWLKRGTFKGYLHGKDVKIENRVSRTGGILGHGLTSQLSYFTVMLNLF